MTNCESCSKKYQEIDMVLPDCSATVDKCRHFDSVLTETHRDMARFVGCLGYESSLQVAIWNAIKNILGKKEK